jgi:exodeoxyribonuclease-5
MDYAYCMTVHKSQGSEWDNVIIIDDYPSFSKVNDPESYNRWLYTAITRSRSIAILVRSI